MRYYIALASVLFFANPTVYAGGGDVVPPEHRALFKQRRLQASTRVVRVRRSPESLQRKVGTLSHLHARPTYRFHIGRERVHGELLIEDDGAYVKFLD